MFDSKQQLESHHVHQLLNLEYQFVKFLNDSGVTEIEAVGKPFDPHFHEAVMQISSDEWEDDTVSMVLKKGYMYKDMVLRPSSVQVSHKP